jgi:hypothetical protein
MQTTHKQGAWSDADTPAGPCSWPSRVLTPRHLHTVMNKAPTPATTQPLSQSSLCGPHHRSGVTTIPYEKAQPQPCPTSGSSRQRRCHNLLSPALNTQQSIKAATGVHTHTKISPKQVVQNPASTTLHTNITNEAWWSHTVDHSQTQPDKAPNWTEQSQTCFVQQAVQRPTTGTCYCWCVAILQSTCQPAVPHTHSLLPIWYITNYHHRHCNTAGTASTTSSTQQQPRTL